MCFTLIQKTKPQIKIAKRNITCFKVMSEDLRPFWRGGEPYKLNEIFYAKNENGNKIKKLRIINNVFLSSHWLVYEGIHSLRYFLENYPKPIVKCQIPKGSKYLLNDYEYVSTKIKPIKIIK